jgi:peroxiredoxin
MGTTLRLSGALLAAVALLTALSCGTPISASAPSPESLLRGALDYLQGLTSAQVNADVSMQVKMMGQNQTMNSTASIRFERPNKFALVADGGVLGLTFIADGKQVVTYMPMLNRYTVSDVGKDASAGGLPGGAQLIDLATSFDAAKAYDQIMKRVTSSKYIGREEVGGIACHRCRYDSDLASIDVWFEAGNRPLVQKIAPDLTKTFAKQADANEAMKDMQIEWVVTFKDWDTDATLTDADFAFTPPIGAKKVDSLMGGSRDMVSEMHPLVGQPAPPFEIEDLDGNTISLANYLGKDVVVLDFWATWCGPCVAAMPELAEVTSSFRDQGVVFYAVNIGEEKQAVVDFLQEQKLEVPVALDAKSTVAALYRVSGIPQTVLIGNDSKVQVVHVGYGSNMKTQLTDELEQLLAGKDLAAASVAEAAEAHAKRAERLAEANASPELKLAWTHPGAWNGVATDATNGLAYACSSSGSSVVALDARGEQQAEHELQGAGSTLRLAQLTGDAQAEFLTFTTWSSGLSADANDGRRLWDYPAGQGIDDVWAADLDQDGRDEVIVGYNGGTGLHVLKSDGSLSWKDTDLANVWHVAAGDLDGDGKNEVIATSARGMLHVFSADGKHLNDVSVPLYANMVRTASLDGADKPAVALAGGMGDSGELLVCVDLEGKQRWLTPLPEADVPSIDAMMVAESRPWAAVAMRGGLIHVVNLETGTIFAHAVDQGLLPQVAWLERKDQSPLLLVASGAAVNAFEVSLPAAE